MIWSAYSFEEVFFEVSRGFVDHHREGAFEEQHHALFAKGELLGVQGPVDRLDQRENELLAVEGVVVDVVVLVDQLLN